MALYSGYIAAWSIAHPERTPPPEPPMPLRQKLKESVNLVPCFLLIALVWFCLRRRRKAKARRQREIVLPSPILPLQNPDVEGGYFFGGHGGVAQPAYNPMREKYLAQGPAMSQPYGTGATMQGRASPYAEKGYNDFPRPMPAAALRDSAYASDTATLVSVDGVRHPGYVLEAGA